ncbi:MAG: hypothetical protein ACREHV_09870 [Rhizomicrobium sp.]
MPDKKLLNAVVFVPWGYAVLWYFANGQGGRIAYWANWGWLAIMAAEAALFFLIRAQERRQPPP